MSFEDKTSGGDQKSYITFKITPTKSLIYNKGYEELMYVKSVLKSADPKQEDKLVK